MTSVMRNCTSNLCELSPCSETRNKKRQKLKSGVLFLLYHFRCDNGVLLTHKIPVRISVFKRGCEHYATVSRDSNNALYVNIKNCVVKIPSRDPTNAIFHVTSSGTEDKQLTFEASTPHDMHVWTQVFDCRNYRSYRKSALSNLHSKAWSDRRAYSLPTLSEEDET